MNKVIFLGLFISLLTISKVSAQQDSASVKIIDFQLCKDVIEREPYEVVSTFSLSDQKAWVFTRIMNAQNLHTLTFKWFLEDELVAEVPVKVGVSKNWRTYSNINLRAGFWRVAISDSLGNILKEARFNVSE